MKYTTALAERIVERVAAGELLRDVAKSKGMPLLQTLRRWRKRHAEFAKLLADAFTESAESLITEMADIRAELKGELDLGACRSAEIRLKNLTWLAAKLDKERYGDRQQVDLSTQVTLQIRDYSGLRVDGPGIDARPVGFLKRKSLLREPKVLPAEIVSDSRRRRVIEADV